MFICSLSAKVPILSGKELRFLTCTKQFLDAISSSNSLPHEQIQVSLAGDFTHHAWKLEFTFEPYVWYLFNLERRIAPLVLTCFKEFKSCSTEAPILPFACAGSVDCISSRYSFFFRPLRLKDGEFKSTTSCQLVMPLTVLEDKYNSTCKSEIKMDETRLTRTKYY